MVFQRTCVYFILGHLMLLLLITNLSGQATRPASTRLEQNAKNTLTQLDTLLNQGHQNLAKQPAVALSLFEQALILAKKNKHKKAVAQCFGGMGMAYSHLQKHDKAVLLLHRALAQLPRSVDMELEVQLLTQLSRDKRFLSELDSTIYFSHKALALQQKAGLSIQISNNYFEIGVAYDLKGELDAAIRNLLQALKAAKKESDKAQIALVSNSLGVVNRRAGNDKKALEYYLQAKTQYLALNDQRNLGNALHNIGEMYLSQQNFEEGMKYTLQGKAIREKIADAYGLAFSYQNLAYVYFNHVKDFKRAFQADSLAYAMRQKIGDQSGMATSLNDMAWDLLELGDLPGAAASSTKALALAQKLGARSIIKNCYELLSKIALKQGKLADALKYQQRFYELKDSLFNEDKNKVIQELQVKYETTQKEQLLNEKQLILERRTVQRNWLLLVTILLILLALVVFFALRNRLKYTQRLAEQAADLQTQRITTLEQNQKIMLLDAMMQGQEAERQRVAKDLHDGLGGLLSSIKHHIRALNEQGLTTSPIFQKANNMLDEAHEEVRRIAHNMMPDALAKLGLVAAVEDLAETYRSAGLRITVHHSERQPQLSAAQDVMLFRIIQELLQNIAKHAQATQVYIQLSAFENNLVLTVEDDGLGYNPNEVQAREGMGLKSIASRATYLNGTFEVESALGKGTVSIVTLPVQEGVH